MHRHRRGYQRQRPPRPGSHFRQIDGRPVEARAPTEHGQQEGASHRPGAKEPRGDAARNRYACKTLRSGCHHRRDTRRWPHSDPDRPVNASVRAVSYRPEASPQRSQTQHRQAGLSQAERAFCLRPDDKKPRARTGVCRTADSGSLAGGLPPYATATGIFPILACHSRGPVVCTEVPCASTATVTGISLTSNS